MTVNHEIFLGTLEKASKHPNTKHFHETSKNYHEFILDRIANYPALDSESNSPDENQIRIGAKRYPLTKEEIQYWMTDRFSRVPVIKDKSIFDEVITKIKLKLETNTTSKFQHFYKEFFKIPNAKKFLHDYLYYLLLSSSAQDEYTYKLTRLSISLAEAVLSFIIMDDDKLRTIFKCFDINQENVSAKDLSVLANIVRIIFNKDSPYTINNKKEFFTSTNIITSTMQEYVLEYLETLFLKEYQTKTIYTLEIYVLMKNYLEKNNVSDQTQTTEHYLTLGYYLIDFFIHYDLFIKQPMTKKGSIKITASPEFVSEVFTTKPHQIPYLTEEDLSLDITNNYPLGNYQQIIKNNIGKLIHDNPRISMKLNDECYLHKNKLFTRLSINIPQLINILELIMNGMKESYMFSILDVNPKIVEKLRESSLIKNFMKILIEDTLNFNEPMRGKKYREHLILIEKDLSKTYEQNKKCEKLLPSMLIEFENYNNILKPLAIELINKICQRKNLFVSLIEDAIRHSLFKFFIVTSYLDARARTYSSAVSLNVHNNPIAKILVNLYDRNEGNCLAYENLPIIRAALRYEQTKNAILYLKKKEIEKRKRPGQLKYILTYLNISLNELVALVLNPALCNKTVNLLDYILTIIKKPKKLFYVMSLIQYECLYQNNVQEKTIITYGQLDSSMNGNQMLTAFFRDPKSAITCNLTGKEDYDGYRKASDYCYASYKKLIEFTENLLKIFNFSDLYEHQLNLQFKEISKEHYNYLLTNPNITLHIMALINMDFKISAYAGDFLYNLVMEINNNHKELYENLINYSFIKPYLSAATTKMINDFLETKRFAEYRNILEYIFCIREAIRITYIGKTIIAIDESNSVELFNRDLTKNHAMTALYMSTAYSRKETYTDKLKKTFLLPLKGMNLIEEFSTFLEKSAGIFLSEHFYLDRIKEFTNCVCGNTKIIINNRNFTITLYPKISKSYQVSCPSFTTKRGPQLVIKKYTDDLNSEKLKSMFMANLAHTMDSDLMHHFRELCIDINHSLEQNNHSFRLIFETNHDCFILNDMRLLPILLEEAYLRFCNQDNFNNICGLSPAVKNKFVKSSIEDFIKILNPINPYFIK